MPREEILLMLEAAMMAPSARNSRPWEFVVVESPAVKQQLMEAHPYCGMLATASLAVVVEKDFDSGAEASQEAESYGVSPAKLDLMKEVQRRHPGLTLEELSDWSCGKLFAALEEEV